MNRSRLVAAVDAFLHANGDAPEAAKEVIEAATNPLKYVERSRAARDLEALVRDVLEGRRTDADVLNDIAFAELALDEPEPPPPPDDIDVDPDLAAFLNEPEPEYDWVVPGLVEKGDRVILTAGEGAGKSTLLRQMAVQIAAGIHPFSLDPIDPVPVLYIDLENSRRHTRRELRPLSIQAGERLAREMMRVIVRPEGIDLRDDTHVAWLGDRVQVDRPDVVVIGPLYKMAGGDPTAEEPAKKVATALDWIRSTFGCAVLIEAHQAYGAGGKRPERPYGASLWSRWPEFGIYLSPQGQLRHWRGQRDERAWPSALQRGGEWPWTPVTDQRALTFARIVEELHLVGRRLSVRELAMVIGADRNQIQRAIDNNRAQFEGVCEELGE